MSAQWARDLPSELATKVFSYLDPASVCSVGASCRAWSVLSSDPSIWHRLCAASATTSESRWAATDWKAVFLGHQRSRSEFLRRRKRVILSGWMLLVMLALALSLYEWSAVELPQHQRLQRHSVCPGTVLSAMVLSSAVTDDDVDEESVEHILYEVHMEYEYSCDGGQTVFRSESMYASADYDVFEDFHQADALRRRFAVGDEISVRVSDEDGHPFVFTLRSAEPGVVVGISIAVACLAGMVGTSKGKFDGVSADSTMEWKTFVQGLGDWSYELLDASEVPQQVRGVILLLLSLAWCLLAGVPFARVLQANPSFWVSLTFAVTLFIALATMVIGLRCLALSLVIAATSVYCPRRPYLVLGGGRCANTVFVRHRLRRPVHFHHVQLVLTLVRVDLETYVTEGGEQQTRRVRHVIHEQSESIARNLQLDAGDHIIGQVRFQIPAELHPSSPAYQQTFPKHLWHLEVLSAARTMPQHVKQVAVNVLNSS